MSDVPLCAVPFPELLAEIARRYKLQCEVGQRRRDECERVARERDEALARLSAAGGEA